MKNGDEKHTNWPTEEELKLNTQQRSALIKTVTRSISIIWGLPGTGKSAVSVEIIKTLLFNDQHWRGIAKFASRKEISGPATHLSDMVRKNLRYWAKRRDPIPDSRSPMLVISKTVDIKLFLKMLELK